MESKGRWQTDAWWKAVATAIAGMVAKFAPLVALWMGTAQGQAFQAAGDAISSAILALGALVIALSGVIEACHHISLPPPADKPRAD